MTNYVSETDRALVQKLTPIYIKEWDSDDIVPSLVSNTVMRAHNLGATNSLLDRIDSNTTYKDVQQYLEEIEKRNKEMTKEENKKKTKKIMIIGAIVIVVLVAIFLFK